MKFEHLIQINDASNPLIVALSREQLWAGLQRRVDDPLPFLPGLESCVFLERTADTCQRQLNFGASTIRDQVSMKRLEWVRFDIEPSASHAGGRLTIRIEEPQDGALFLRFTYQTSLAESGPPEDSAYVEYVKSAYHASDIDTVRIIRTLAADESLQ